MFGNRRMGSVVHEDMSVRLAELRFAEAKSRESASSHSNTQGCWDSDLSPENLRAAIDSTRKLISDTSSESARFLNLADALLLATSENPTFLDDEIWWFVRRSVREAIEALTEDKTRAR